MDHKSSGPDPALLEQYRQQMMEMYRRQQAEETNWLDRDFPEPKSVFDRQTEEVINEISIITDPPENTEELPPIAETPFVGYLRVFVTAAEGAQPLSGAYVTVTRENTVYANTVTDQDGYTQVIPLPSVDPALTLTPGNPAPYWSYNIRIHADGFRTAQYNNVPVYGNDYVTQPAILQPLLYNDDPQAVQDFVSGGPENL